MGRDALLATIEQYNTKQKIDFTRVTFAFEGPKNIGLVTSPPPVYDTDKASYTASSTVADESSSAPEFGSTAMWRKNVMPSADGTIHPDWSLSVFNNGKTYKVCSPEYKTADQTKTILKEIITRLMATY